MFPHWFHFSQPLSGQSIDGQKKKKVISKGLTLLKPCNQKINRKSRIWHVAVVRLEYFRKWVICEMLACRDTACGSCVSGYHQQWLQLAHLSPDTLPYRITMEQKQPRKQEWGSRIYPSSVWPAAWEVCLFSGRSPWILIFSSVNWETEKSSIQETRGLLTDVVY